MGGKGLETRRSRSLPGIVGSKQNVERGRTLALGIAWPLGVQTPAKSKQRQAFRNDPTSLQVANDVLRTESSQRRGMVSRIRWVRPPIRARRPSTMSQIIPGRGDHTPDEDCPAPSLGPGLGETRILGPP